MHSLFVKLLDFRLCLLLVVPSVRGLTSPPSSFVLTCKEDGVWRQTLIGTNATRRDGACSNQNTIIETRRCGLDQKWDDPYCPVVLPHIINETLHQILDSPAEGLNSLSLLVSSPSRNVSIEEYVFLFNTVLQSQQALNQSTTQEFIQEFLGVALKMVQIFQMVVDVDSRRRSLGARLLITLDYFALTIVKPSNATIIVEDEIFLRVLELNQSSSATTTNITSIDVVGNSIMPPPEILGQQTVRIASFLYQNLSSLLCPKDNMSKIISPVISTTIDYQMSPRNVLSKNTIIQLQVTDFSGVDPGANISCAFFQFEFEFLQDNSSLEANQITGDWSTEGCSSTVNGDIVTCSCNHLTHFAILLMMDENDDDPYIVLTTIGLFLIPTSLLCMVLVILTYSLMRSLWSMRNYIHIMLCVSLFMAQLVYVAGVDMPNKDKNEGLCSAIAVLLQYLFLVTFMWMLMEGVVLYVSLVKVFVQNYKYYVIGFTVASYVIPAVYMAPIVPIGFLVGVDNIPGHTHYLFYIDKVIEACWINYNGWFLWLLIVPVAITVLVNAGFIIMAIMVMWKHRKRQKNSISDNMKYWLRTSVSLSVVMGITWIANIIAFIYAISTMLDALTPLFLALQDYILFIVLVPLSKEVREAYKRLWKKIVPEMLSRLRILMYSSTNSSSLPTSTTPSNEHEVGGIELGKFASPYSRNS